MRVVWSVLAAACVAATANAAIIDFGTDPGQAYAGMTVGGSFSVGGGYGFNANLSRTREFTADSLKINYTAAATASYSGGGKQYSGTYFRNQDLTGAQLDSKLKVTSRIIMGTATPNFYEFRVMLTAVDGSSSTYHLKLANSANPAPLSYGTDPASVPFTTVESTTMLSAPTSVNGTNGAFSFASDTLNQVDIYFKTGATNAGGTFTWEIDSLEVVVPEPSMIGLLGTSALLALRRRRA